MVNYTRVLRQMALVGVLLTFASAAPMPHHRHKYYDQRQNGAENGRLKISNVALLVALPETESSIWENLDDDDKWALSVIGFTHQNSQLISPGQSQPSSSSTPAAKPTEMEDKPKPMETPLDQEKLLEGKPLESKPTEYQSTEQKPSEGLSKEQKQEISSKLTEVSQGSDTGSEKNIQKTEVLSKKLEH